MYFVKKHLSQAGDTIVEVMFAVAVVGMVIGGSYVIATRASRTGRYAQEQTEALKQAETQIEKLKYMASLGLTGGVNYIFNAGAGQNTFCVNDTFNKILLSNASAYATDCKARGGDQLYDVLVTYTQSPLSGGSDLFNVAVSWDRQGTTLRGNVQVAYRLHNAPSL